MIQKVCAKKLEIPIKSVYGERRKFGSDVNLIVTHMEKRKKAGKTSKKIFFGFLRSKPTKRKMTFFNVFDLKNPRKFFFEFLPVFFRFSILCDVLAGFIPRLIP